MYYKLININKLSMYILHTHTETNEKATWKGKTNVKFSNKPVLICLLAPEMSSLFLKSVDDWIGPSFFSLSLSIMSSNQTGWIFFSFICPKSMIE